MTGTPESPEPTEPDRQEPAPEPVVTAGSLLLEASAAQSPAPPAQPAASGEVSETEAPAALAQPVLEDAPVPAPAAPGTSAEVPGDEAPAALAQPIVEDLPAAQGEPAPAEVTPAGEPAPVAEPAPTSEPEPARTSEPEPAAEPAPTSEPEPAAEVPAVDVARVDAEAAPGESVPSVQATPAEATMAPGAAPAASGGGTRPQGKRQSRRSDKPARPRRRRPNAAQKHRTAFFNRLTELRRAEQPADASGVASPAAAPLDEAAAEGSRTDDVMPAAPTDDVTVSSPTAHASAPQASAPAAEAPAVEEVAEPAAEGIAAPVAAATPVAEEPVAPVSEEAPAAAAEESVAPVPEGAPAAAAAGGDTPAEGEAAPSGDDGATETGPAVPAQRVPRLVIAIERVGGPEAVRGALAPKADEKGQPMKWAAVCAEAATGLTPGDPVFLAWIRLAATPVRTIKGEVSERGGPGGRRGGGPPGQGGGRAGGGQGGAGQPGGGGQAGGRPGGGFAGGGGRGGGRGDREDRGPRVTAKDLAGAQDGKIGTSVRFVTDDSAARKERDRRKKEEREAKREAERARLERLGY